MGVEADPSTEQAKKQVKTGPPFTCPIDKCGKTYKTNCGLQYHLKSYDHENPTTQMAPTTPATPKNKKGLFTYLRKANKQLFLCACVGRVRNVGVNKSVMPNSPAPITSEPLTFDEVQFEIDGQVVRVNINETLAVTSKEKNNSEDDAKGGGDATNKGCLFCFYVVFTDTHT